jgi:hypothetical protein
MRKVFLAACSLLLCPLLVAQQVPTTAASPQQPPTQTAQTASSAAAQTAQPSAPPPRDVTFGNVKLADPKGRLTGAALIFSDSTKSVLVRVSGRDVASIPYANVDKLSYEYTKKHRITSGAIVMVFSLGAGAVVMLTKSKSNWFYIDYHDKDSKELIVLKLEKKDLPTIFQAAKDHAGKEVVNLGDAGKG